MSVTVPATYIEVLTAYGTPVIDDPLHLTVKLAVTNAIGSYEVRVPHQVMKDLSHYSSINTGNIMYIWLGNINTGSSPLISGPIDSLQSELTKNGYVMTIQGRDYGSILMRNPITKTYHGYDQWHPEKTPYAGTSLTDIFTMDQTGSYTPNTETTVTIGVGGGVGDFFLILPYGESLPLVGDIHPPVFTGLNCGWVSTGSVQCTGSDFSLQLKYVNASDYGHVGRLWARSFIDPDGTVALTPWTSGSTITFPDDANYVVTETIDLTPYASVRPNGQPLLVQLIWEVTSYGSDATAGLALEMASALFSVPDDKSLPKNIIGDLLSGSSISMGACPFVDVALTRTFNKKSRFDCIKEVANVVGIDTYMYADFLQAILRGSNTHSGIISTGSLVTFKHIRDSGKLCNSATVFGAGETTVPSNPDLWTEYPSSGWQVTSGSITEGWYPTSPLPYARVGTRVLGAFADGANWITVGRPFDRVDENSKLNFWMCCNPGGGVFFTKDIKLMETSGSENYFVAFIKATGTGGGFPQFQLNTYELGSDNVSGSTTSGDWFKHGEPSWDNIKYIEFACCTDLPNLSYVFDAVYFSGIKWSGSARDAGSISAYGLHEQQEISDFYHSDEQCVDRAQEIVDVGKGLVDQYILTISGDATYDAGELVGIQLPCEGVPTTSYLTALEVEHIISVDAGFQTVLTLGSGSTIRDPSLLNNFGLTASYWARDIKNAASGLKSYR
jgi:hypothetical protein